MVSEASEPLIGASLIKISAKLAEQIHAKLPRRCSFGDVHAP